MTTGQPALARHKKLPKAKGASKTAGVLRPTQFLRQIAATDKCIDALVYQLYGLTEKEIRIVEEATW